MLLADDVLEMVRRVIEGRKQRREIAKQYGDAEAIIRHSEVIDDLSDILSVFDAERRV